MCRGKVKIITGGEFNHLRSQIVTSNDNLNLKSQFATIEGRRGKHRKYLPYAFTTKTMDRKNQCHWDYFQGGTLRGHLWYHTMRQTFKAASAQQAVSQLTQIPWGQNITKNLPDEFRSSLPSIEEIEAELSRVEESQ